jgi:hypothetical protein
MDLFERLGRRCEFDGRRRYVAEQRRPRLCGRRWNILDRRWFLYWLRTWRNYRPALLPQ